MATDDERGEDFGGDLEEIDGRFTSEVMKLRIDVKRAVAAGSYVPLRDAFIKRAHEIARGENEASLQYVLEETGLTGDQPKREPLFITRDPEPNRVLGGMRAAIDRWRAEHGLPPLLDDADVGIDPGRPEGQK